jgi:hypothetical protein
MPAKNVEQIKIWKPAHEWLKQVSAAYKSRGESSASMTSLASRTILSIPMPNCHTVAPIATIDEAGSAPTEEEKP